MERTPTDGPRVSVPRIITALGVGITLAPLVASCGSGGRSPALGGSQAIFAQGAQILTPNSAPKLAQRVGG